MITKDYLGYLQASSDTKRQLQAVYMDCFTRLTATIGKYRAQQAGLAAIKQHFPEVAAERNSLICFCFGIWEVQPACHVCDDQGCQDC